MVESVKAASDVNCPVGGVVPSANSKATAPPAGEVALRARWAAMVRTTAIATASSRSAANGWPERKAAVASAPQL